MKEQIKLSLAAMLLGGFGALIAPAQIAGNPPYTLDQAVIAGGGTSSASGTYSITGAVGQAVAGTTSTSSPYALSGGFFTPQVLAPTAAGVTLSGRVRMENGKGIRNVRITLTTVDGSTRTTLSGLSGGYSFADVAAGQTVIISAAAKRFVFSQPTQILSLNEETNGVDFVGIPQFFIE